MSSDQATTTGKGVCCGACDAVNGADAKYCVGCGKTLYEKCSACNRQVLLTQKFCESCGADLEACSRDLRQKYQQYITDAITAARESRFDRALLLLNRVVGNEDYRVAAEAQKAGQAIERIRQLKATAEAEVEASVERANQACAAGDRPLAAKLLATVPDAMMTDEVKKLRGKIEAFLIQRRELDQKLRAAIAEKDWLLIGSIVDRLLDLCPDDEGYRRVATQVGEKLALGAKQLLEQGSYRKAIDTLLAVPMLARSESYQQLKQRATDVQWLSEQLASEPIATPMLGRLAMRFAKEVPEDARAKKIVRQLAERLKTGPREDRAYFPVWKNDSESAFGGSIGVLTGPKEIHLREHASIKSSSGRFNVAFGLAIQGLGAGRIEGHFCEKKGLLGGRVKRKGKVWGVDLGSASIKAVCLQEIDGRLTVIDAFIRDYETPTCREGNQAIASNLLGKAIKEFLDDKGDGIKDTGIWCNLPAASLIIKTPRLPPVKDKQAVGLLDQEIKQTIPIPMHDLSLVRWIAAAGDDKIYGRSALAAVARKEIVDARLAQLNSFGLKVDGLQGDTLALVNFIAYEFSEDLSETSDSQNQEKTPAVLLVDCGASVTNLAIVSGEEQWAWTFESGGEDFTSRIAVGANLTRAEAEKIKQNPAEMYHPAEQYHVVEQRQDASRARIEAAVREALQQNQRFRITQSFCCGGGCLGLGWMRRIMLRQS